MKFTSNKKLFLELYEMAISSMEAPSNMISALKQVTLAQIASREQLMPSTSLERIRDITLLKGGDSLLFYRTAMKLTAAKTELSLLFQLGGLMQLCNDIFDVYKDREAGIRTLVTEAAHIKPIQEELTAGLETQFERALSYGFNKMHVHSFFATLSLGIFSRALTCLYQLKRAEAGTAGVFTVSSYTRKQLICDMELPANLARSAGYHIKLMNQFRRV